MTNPYLVAILIFGSLALVLAVTLFCLDLYSPHREFIRGWILALVALCVLILAWSVLLDPKAWDL